MPISCERREPKDAIAKQRSARIRCERRYQSALNKLVKRKRTASEIERPEIHATTSVLMRRPSQMIQTAPESKIGTCDLLKSKNASDPFAQCKKRFARWNPVAFWPQSARSSAKLNQNS